MDDETRKRIDQTLDRAGKDDLVLVAVMDATGAAIHTVMPNPLSLVNLASTLLDQAADLLREQGAENSDLAETIEDALALLPDRFADPNEEAASDA